MKKDLARVEKQVERAKERLALLTAEQEKEAFNPGRLTEIVAEISDVESELKAREEEWLELTLALES
jgi:ATP-binding cassette subfamily F protein uup